MRILPAFTTCLLLAGLGNGPAAAQGAQSGEASFFSKLAGPGGSVRFEYDAAPDGTPAKVRLSQGPGGVFEGFRAEGSLFLETSDFTLRSRTLDYAPNNDILNAIGDVEIVRTDVEATAGELRYTVSSGDIALSDDPDVTQRAQNSETHFQGMELFQISSDEAGDRDLELTGADPIVIAMNNNTSSTPPSAASSDESKGFGAFGDKVTITTSPRAGADPMAPKVRSRINAEGGLDYFRAEGSVRLESATINLRANELLYEPERQIVEATGDVFLRREGIEADCGRMVYDLQSGQITLTINPVVSQIGQTSVTTISDIDYFVIIQREDGGADVEYGSSDGPGRTEIRNLEPDEDPAGTQPGAAPGAVEIDPNRPTQLP